MKFNFALEGEIKGLTPKREQEFFAKARGKDPKVNAIDCGIHREWVRDVITIFASKAELSLANARMVVGSGSFNGTCLSKMHLNAAEKASAQIMVGGEKQPNPYRARQLDLSEMGGDARHDFMKEAWLFAVSLQHPKTVIRYSGTRDAQVNSNKLVQDHIGSRKHQSETRQAHHERTIAALALYNSGDKLGAALVHSGVLG